MTPSTRASLRSTLAQGLRPWLAVALLCAFAPPAYAGGGPETVLVVVNEGSPASLHVANHYVQQRGIPATHICPVPQVPTTGTITVDEFRDLIWAPIEAFMKEHGLADQIDIIAYSADFPFGVNYDPDFKGETLPQGTQKYRVASLTGMTYLHRHVKAKSREYLDLAGNQYFRHRRDDLLPSHGFRSRHVWSRDVDPQAPEVGEDSPDRYYLATMLGFTGTLGNTVPEILRYLDRGKASDGKRPKGTVYLMEHKDVRARTRMPFFRETVRALKKRRVRVAVLAQGKASQDGKVPVTKSDVAGCVAGIAGFNWQSAGSEFCDGAIAEHLTSFGAKFDTPSQTKISEFLRYGAVGSAGAVAEPYALHEKFPLPFLHVHYADGCCLAEAFYQSVSGPYQLLVVGDPLARPYAKFGDVKIAGPDTKEPWTGTVAVGVEASAARGKQFGTVELWLRGVRVAEVEPGTAIDLDTTKYADGHHELRAVAVEKSRIETRSWTRQWIRIDNHGRTVTLKGPKKAAPLASTVTFSGKAPSAGSVELLQGNRLVAEAKVTSGSWKTTVRAGTLGVGATELQARATYEDGTHAYSRALVLAVKSPVKADKKKKRTKKRKKKPKKGKSASQKGKAGLEATVVDKKGEERTFPMETIGRAGSKRFLKRLQSMVRAGTKSIRLRGELHVKERGLYQLAINAAGTLKIRAGGKTVFEGETLAWKRQTYASLPLDGGWHTIEIDYEPSDNGDLSVILGGAQVAAPLAGKAIRH